jgi:hypothetical protein
LEGSTCWIAGEVVRYFQSSAKEFLWFYLFRYFNRKTDLTKKGVPQEKYD